MTHVFGTRTSPHPRFKLFFPRLSSFSSSVTPLLLPRLVPPFRSLEASRGAKFDHHIITQMFFFPFPTLITRVFMFCSLSFFSRLLPWKLYPLLISLLFLFPFPLPFFLPSLLSFPCFVSFLPSLPFLVRFGVSLNSGTSRSNILFTNNPKNSPDIFYSIRHFFPCPSLSLCVFGKTTLYRLAINRHRHRYRYRHRH